MLTNYQIRKDFTSINCFVKRYSFLYFLIFCRSISSSDCSFIRRRRAIAILLWRCRFFLLFRNIPRLSLLLFWTRRLLLLGTGFILLGASRIFLLWSGWPSFLSFTLPGSHSSFHYDRIVRAIPLDSNFAQIGRAINHFIWRACANDLERICPFSPPLKFVNNLNKKYHKRINDIKIIIK